MSAGTGPSGSAARRCLPRHCPPRRGVGLFHEAGRVFYPTLAGVCVRYEESGKGCEVESRAESRGAREEVGDPGGGDFLQCGAALGPCLSTHRNRFLATAAITSAGLIKAAKFEEDESQCHSSSGKLVSFYPAKSTVRRYRREGLAKYARVRHEMRLKTRRRKNAREKLKKEKAKPREKDRRKKRIASIWYATQHNTKGGRREKGREPWQGWGHLPCFSLRPLRPFSPQKLTSAVLK